MGKLSDIKVAILVADGFEQSEFQEPKKALEQAGAKTVVVSPVKGKVKAWQHKNWGEEIKVDKELAQANADEFDALLLPGGVINPDTLRLFPEAINFIKKFVSAHKPIAAICHGPWTLINAQAVKGKTVTSWPSIKTDLINAGANLITSRKPEDLPAFNRAIIEAFANVRSVR
jgi:protease I